jgi:hypothetical protein
MEGFIYLSYLDNNLSLKRKKNRMFTANFVSSIPVEYFLGCENSN